MATDKPIPIGLIKRLVIMFYDAILLLAVIFFASILISVPLNITYGDPLYPLFVIYIYIVGFVFLGWCWTHGGQTLGLKTWKVKLVADNGGPVTWKQSLLRYFASLLCWLSCGIGFLWCYTNKERLAWNDLFSKTRLQRVEKLDGASG